MKKEFRVSGEIIAWHSNQLWGIPQELRILRILLGLEKYIKGKLNPPEEEESLKKWEEMMDEGVEKYYKKYKYAYLPNRHEYIIRKV